MLDFKIVENQEKSGGAEGLLLSFSLASLIIIFKTLTIYIIPENSREATVIVEKN